MNVHKNLYRLWLGVREAIDKRLGEFRQLAQSADDETLFWECAFCLLTPQSKAQVCWEAVKRVRAIKIFHGIDSAILAGAIHPVRFKHNKARYVIAAWELFREDASFHVRKIIESCGSPFLMREWLVKNVTGLGYKEAGHFLRNIGFSTDLAILDRHILKNLKQLDVIPEVPGSLPRLRYLDVEMKMRRFARAVGIPMAHLDLLLWYKEAGTIFK